MSIYSIWILTSSRDINSVKLDQHLAVASGHYIVRIKFPFRVINCHSTHTHTLSLPHSTFWLFLKKNENFRENLKNGLKRSNRQRGNVRDDFHVSLSGAAHAAFFARKSKFFVELFRIKKKTLIKFII